MPPQTRCRALLSVADKTELVPFARRLAAIGFELVATGGTARALSDAGLLVTSVAEVTGHPEILEGRVKTLHPAIFGGILARTSHESDVTDLKTAGIAPIDLVVVNLYPFVQTIARGAGTDEIVENIDIGGSALIRAAAKNADRVLIVTNPADYDRCATALETGDVTSSFRRKLAAAAFAHTATYDAAIAGWMGRDEGQLTTSLHQPMTKVSDLRYGENPHQKAALYAAHGQGLGGEYGPMRCLGGKALSYNNLLDLDAAVALVREFTDPAAVVVKHTNPCGCAIVPGGDASVLPATYLLARSADPMSAFGSIVAVNDVVDEKLAAAITETFVEVIAAPQFSEAALAQLATKKNLRIVEGHGLHRNCERHDEPPALRTRSLGLGTLAQEADRGGRADTELSFATSRHPTDDEVAALRFGWTTCAHVKSNAIVIAGWDSIGGDGDEVRGLRTYGVGAGQMSRVDAVHIAVRKAQGDLQGTIVASDAFFPFADGLLVAVEAGVTAVIQPGGSRRDDEVVAAANDHGVAMAMTGVRHFRH